MLPSCLFNRSSHISLENFPFFEIGTLGAGGETPSGAVSGYPVIHRDPVPIGTAESRTVASIPLNLHLTDSVGFQYSETIGLSSKRASVILKKGDQPILYPSARYIYLGSLGGFTVKRPQYRPVEDFPYHDVLAASSAFRLFNRFCISAVISGSRTWVTITLVTFMTHNRPRSTGTRP